MFFPYRDENPRQSLPYLTVGLITLNVVLYVGLNLGADYRWVVEHYGLVPAHPSPLTGLTWQFLHGGLLHLLGNMWFLWLFGDNVEDALGWWFVPFYLTCGLMAGFLHIALVSWPSMGIPAIGASGAISGVLGAYLMLYPQARIACVCGLVFIYFRTSLRAVWFIGIWFCFQLLGALLTHFGLTGGIAYWAHIGGFLFGAAVVWPIRAQIRPAPATLQSGPEGLLPALEHRWFIGIWFCFQLLGALLTHFGLTGGIAYWAHIGGFLFGAAVVWPIREQIRPAPATLQSGPEGLERPWGFLPSAPPAPSRVCLGPT